jgi:DNA-binding transcriptional regulator PaaX
MTKYKYYFRKPTSEITKDILKGLAVAGVVMLAGSSPFFIKTLLKRFKNIGKYERKKVSDTFYRLRKQGCIEVHHKGKQIYISLTQKGRKKAGWLQIDSLKIEKPRRWDGLWRLVIFDISQLKKTYREALRGKLKDLGFKPLQKSVWIHPYQCKDEVDLLRNFFGLSDTELRLIVAKSIGNDFLFKKSFKIGPKK